MFSPIRFFLRRSHRRLLYPVLSFIVALGLVVGSPRPGQAIPLLELLFRGAQIIQLSNISDNQEVQIGQQINQQLLSREVPLYRNAEIARYVDSIGQRLARNSDRPNLPFTFQVVADRGINAFATMGGFVYVNAGLVAAADNEAQLASVLAHEIAHITARHSVRQMRQSAIAQGLSAAAGLDRNTAVQMGIELALRRPRSRSDEFEADRIGLATLQRAGYAPIAMPNFMEKLLRSGGTPTFLSTHPAVPDRIAALRQLIDPARANVGDGLNNFTHRSQISSLLAQMNR